jgi:DNA invertase Pin-like site-specific DNA recombinase
LVALERFGLEPDEILADKASGKDFDRPQYRRLLRRLHKGDTLVITSIDRLGRNYADIIDEWRRITREKGANVVVLDMPLLDTCERPDGITGTFIADMVLQLLSYVAQVEREGIRQRQAEGIAAAKARGVRFGRPPIPRPDSWGRTARQLRDGELSRREAARRLGVSLSTLNKWIVEDREQQACS